MKGIISIFNFKAGFVQQMRIILKYILVIIFLQACRENYKLVTETNPALYPQPLTVALDTIRGYTINPLSGDSIKPLLNATGDTFKTGVSVPMITKPISTSELVKPTIIEDIQAIKTIIPDNIFPIPENLPFTLVDTTRLKKVKLGEGDRSFVLRNSYGIVPTGVPIPVTGKKMPFIEPHPVKATPMRYKDNTTTSIQYLDVEQGLGYSYINTVCEDKKGNIWLNEDGIGISKYDGVNITTYSVNEGLANNFVRSIIEDRNNKIWIGTLGGVSCFDGKNFTQYTEKDGLPSNTVLSILEDRKANLWFSTAAGLTKYDGKYFTNYTDKEGLQSDGIHHGVYKCIEDRNGNLWIATYFGAVKFDGNSFTYFTTENGLAGNIVSSLLEDKKGNIWVGSIGEGITMLDGKKLTRFTKKEGLSDNMISSLLEDNNRNIWISTLGGGLNKYDGNKFTHYSLEQGLSNSKIRGMANDRSGNLWLATEGGGVNKLNTTSFIYSVPEKVMENNRIRPIMKDKNGALWFGTESAGVGKLNTRNAIEKGNLFTYYSLRVKSVQPGQRSLLEDKNDNIWIGSSGEGLFKYNGKSFLSYSLGNDPLKKIIFDILENKNGNIWFGLKDGTIASYDGKIFSFNTTIEGLPGSGIYSMKEDKKGNIWFCTEGAGVYKFDGINLINYTEKEGLLSKSVLSVTEDEKENIWFGTMGNGVCMFDGKHFTYYTVKQGLANNNVWSAFCDADHQLWFGTDKGLTLFQQKKEGLTQKSTLENQGYNIYNFTQQDGLKAIDFNLHSVCVDNDNHIWWGTGKGVVSYDLNKKFHADSIRSLNLNYIEINERFYDFRNLTDSVAKNISCSNVIPFTNCPENLSLSYDLNHLSFHFSAIDWSAPDKIKYSYRLVGLDEKWSNPLEETMADYRNLGHGNYQFQVRAIGRSQVWASPISYSFTIHPAWWQTWWFKALIIIVALVLLFFIIRFIYYYQLRKERTALEKQLAVQYERQRISAEMHDDIGAGLAGIRLLTEMTKNKVKDEQTAEEVEKIYRSVGDISSKMKEVIWSLNTENDDLPNLISYLQKQARLMMENYPGKFNMTIPDHIPGATIGGELRRHIYLAVKEALHNIIKHAGADKVELTITCDAKLRIVVSDNGKGMNTEQNSSAGNGLRNMRQRMQQIGGNFFIENKEGLTLIFEIPFKTAT